MKQQTAVEYLIEQMMNGNFESKKLKHKWVTSHQAGERNPLEVAKEMEVEQIIKAYHRGLFANMEVGKPTVFADEYYNETYKK